MHILTILLSGFILFDYSANACANGFKDLQCMQTFHGGRSGENVNFAINLNNYKIKRSLRPLNSTVTSEQSQASVVKKRDIDNDAKDSKRIKSKLNNKNQQIRDDTDESSSKLIDLNSNDVKDTERSIEIGVPKFKKKDKLPEPLIKKLAGSSIELICQATGDPSPNITWTLNDAQIKRHSGRVNYNTKKFSIKIDELIREDSGVYKCTICNQYGCIEHSTTVEVIERLRTRPILSDKFPENQTVLVNSSAYFECRVYSDLEPFFQWIKYNNKNTSIRDLEKVVLYNSESIDNEHEDYVVLQKDPDKPNILRLTNVTHSDEGWYSCVAGTSLGRSLASAYLRVVDKLPIPEGSSILRSQSIWITAIILIAIVLLIVSTSIMFILRKIKQEKLLKMRIETVHQWTKKVIIYKAPSCQDTPCNLQIPLIKIEKQRKTFQTSSNVEAAMNEYEFPLDSNWEIARSKLSLGSTLGEGAFGKVVMGEARDLAVGPGNNNNISTIVAVKMVKEEHTDADMASLVREMEVMKMIGKHVNIINLLGCCSQNGPLWVIVEYAPHGNLKNFLKNNRPFNLERTEIDSTSENNLSLTQENLVSFAFQISRGMEYLASRKCIHRDLAARNVLVSDDYVMKIADFGLARDIQDTDYYRKNSNGRLPIKWMAPESLREKFYDSQSDVWSYGVLLWEIMTYGEQPYPHIMSSEELYSYLSSGQRMKKPSSCSLNIYLLMRQCWNFDANSRPTFSDIVENLDKILQLENINSNGQYLDLTMPTLETPPSSDDEQNSIEPFISSPSRYENRSKYS